MDGNWMRREDGRWVWLEHLPCAECRGMALLVMPAPGPVERFVCPRCLPSPDQLEAQGWTTDDAGHMEPPAERA